MVEMVFDRCLAAAGDENELFDAGLSGLVDGVLNLRFIDLRQHFFWHGFRRR